jgi:nanoRNase/pAp phosphatase (c-di-AMP/oligoRNAs hydrolase)
VSPSPETRLSKLDAVLDGGRSLLIVVQNSPDPDAIGAAAALKELAKTRHDLTCSVAHAGDIGRVENLALIRYLGMKTRPLGEVDPTRYDRLAMVDAQPGAGNVSMDPGIRLDAVIDHHPIRRETRRARFTDIRRRYGATSTILREYLRAADADIPTPLATAMVYGIRSDTQDLGRETTRADIEAFLDLYPLANPRMLGRIMAAPLPRHYFAELQRALGNATIHGTRVITFLGVTQSQEMIAETADLLLRVEEATWSMAAGIVGDWLHVSLRSVGYGKPAGTIARNLGGRKGFGGGHATLAAAQIPLAGLANPRRRIRDIMRRFLAATGDSREPAQPLCCD